MINDILTFYDNALLYNPNTTFLLFFVLFAALLFLFFRGLLFLARSLRLAKAVVKQMYTVRPHEKLPHIKLSYKKILSKQSVQFMLLVRVFFRVIDSMEQKVVKKVHKIVDAIAREVLIPVIMIFIISAFLRIFLTPAVFAQKPPTTAYQFPWPGILPDHPLYKLKVLRNKIIAKIIYSPVKLIEFDLLMADKTLYAGKLLLEKGKGDLAKETALKGENYFSILVSDYARAKQKSEVIPGQLRSRIAWAYEAHQQLISYLGQKAPEADKKTYQDIDFFSDENYRVLQNLQNSQPKR